MSIHKAYDYNRKSALAAISDSCLTPVRYLFNGKDVTVIEVQKACQASPTREAFETASFSKRTFLKTALAVVALIPGVIFGALTRLFLQMSATNRQVYQAPVQEHDRTHTVVHVYCNAVQRETLVADLTPHLQRRFPAAEIKSVTSPEESEANTPLFIAYRNEGAGVFFTQDGGFPQDNPRDFNANEKTLIIVSSAGRMMTRPSDPNFHFEAIEEMRLVH